MSIRYPAQKCKYSISLLPESLRMGDGCRVVPKIFGMEIPIDRSYNRQVEDCSHFSIGFLAEKSCYDTSVLPIPTSVSTTITFPV
ncbi:MAG: hypothetical protein WBG66_00165 [Geitlerinemataceae cyanobacterium]